MLGPLGTTLESARQTLRLLGYRKILWFVPLALLALGAFSLVISSRSEGRAGGAHLFCVVAWWALGTVVVPWVTLYLGVQAVHGELEDRTSQYLFLRPVHRVPLLLGKWLAVTAVAVGIAWSSTAVSFAAFAVRSELWPDGVEMHLLWSFGAVLGLGAVAYAAVAVLFGATFRRPLAWAAFFVVGLQMLAANLPISAGMRRLTITDSLRRQVLDLVEPDQFLAKDLWPAERPTSWQVDNVGDAFALELDSPLSNLLIFVAVCLSAAAWRYARTEYESRNRD